MESSVKGRIPNDGRNAGQKVPEWYIDSCLKIKVYVPKPHACLCIALRVASLQGSHTIMYYAAYFSVRADDFDIVAMHQGKEMVKRRIRGNQ